MEHKTTIPRKPPESCNSLRAAAPVPRVTEICLLFAWLSCGAATAEEGLLGYYYSDFSVVSNRIAFDGLTLEATRTDTAFDFWDGSAQYDWNPIGHRAYSVRWTGFLRVTHPGVYGFGTISDDGSEVWIDGERVVDNHEEQWFDWQEGWCFLETGFHRIEITFYERTAYSGIEVWWLKPENAPSDLPYSGEDFYTTPPTFNPDTRWEILGGPSLQVQPPRPDLRLRARALPEDNAVELTWEGSPDVSYVVQSSPDLETWQDCTDVLPGLDGVMTHVVPSTAPHEFFRLRVVE